MIHVLINNRDFCDVYFGAAYQFWKVKLAFMLLFYISFLVQFVQFALTKSAKNMNEF